MNQKQRDSYPDLSLTLADRWLADQMYVAGNFGWAVEDLWDAAAKLPVYEVPLVGFDIDIMPWDGVGRNFKDFLAHVQLVKKADLKYPIILTPSGSIADGRHRLAKAIIDGHSTIKIVRLVDMPEPTVVYDPEGNAMECE